MIKTTSLPLSNTIITFVMKTPDDQQGFSKFAYKSPLVEDQLLTSTSRGLFQEVQGSAGMTKASVEYPKVRSRHCSSNSGASLDSAIGDVYSAQTPPRLTRDGSQDGPQDDGLDREFLDLTTASREAASDAIQRATTPPSGAVSTGGAGSFDIVVLGDDEFGFRLANDVVVDSSGMVTNKGQKRPSSPLKWTVHGKRIESHSAPKKQRPTLFKSVSHQNQQPQHNYQQLHPQIHPEHPYNRLGHHLRPHPEITQGKQQVFRVQF